jgi:2-methylcitrate dehydratase PrpD
MPSHYRFWHTTGTVGTFGAAAAVADLLGCDEAQFAHALATAGTFAAGLQQAFRSEAMSKPFHSGHAAEVGARAAMAAQAGITGALDLLEGAAGFGAAMSSAADWSRATADLGERYCITEMTFKNHGCCGHNFAPIDAVLNIQQAHRLSADDIESIDIATYQAGVVVVDNPRPEGEHQAKFSVQYTVAHALVHGSVRLEAFSAERRADPRVRALMARVRVSADAALSKAYPAQRAARIVVHTRAGSRIEHFQPTRKGDPDMPLSDAELQDKFQELVQPVLGIHKTRGLGRAIWGLSVQPARSLDYFVAQPPTESGQ